ncbi:MAG: hypothetical protein KDB80_12485 [Planctomycetes bacterium]|nr:hypothetical protein [Planctomycetota bacterium]
MAEARFVELEGMAAPCLLVCGDDFPDEIVVDYSTEPQSELSRRGPIVYRLQPSTTKEPHPVYVEVFDE